MRFRAAIRSDAFGNDDASCAGPGHLLSHANVTPLTVGPPLAQPVTLTIPPSSIP